MHKITLIPGDGIGPEVTGAAVKIVEATGVDIVWETKLMGQSALEKFGDPLPKDTVTSIEYNKAALKGPVATQTGVGFRSANVALRQSLNLYANIRPFKTIEGVKSKFENVDIVIFRENTEDLYLGIEHMIGKDAAECVKIITREASERIASMAFSYAVREKRKKVTCVHKANIMKLTDGLFLSSVRDVAKKFPDIEFEDIIVDNACLKLVMNPEQFDVMVLPNLYGDILSDLCAGLIGGLGVAPSVNIGAEAAVFEAIHGTAPSLAGKGIADPTAAIMCAVMMLREIGENVAADKINNAVLKVIKEGKYVTMDLGGNATTQEMTQAIIDVL